MNCYEELLFNSQIGNISSLQSLFSSSSFSQKEIDTGFRRCIKHFKQQNESFIKCIKLYMNKIEDINYQNDTEDNSSIIMYCFTEGQETPSELIISCLLQDIDVNIIDNNNETCLFKLIRLTKLSEATQKEFLSSLLTKKVDLNYANKSGETLMSLASKMNRPLILEYIKAFIKGSKFDIGEYVNLFIEEKYIEAISKLKQFQEKENAFVQNNAFMFNTLVMSFLMKLKAAMESKITIKSNIFQQNNSVVTITGMNSNDFINEYYYQMISLLKGLNVNNNIDPVLLLNKAFMLYQLNDEEKFQLFIKTIESNEDLSQIKYVYFYIKVLTIDMLIERRQFIEAKRTLNELSSGIHLKNSTTFNFSNTFFSKHSFISGNDKMEIDNTLTLFTIYLESFEKGDNKKAFDGLKQINDESNALVSQLYLCLNIKLLYHSIKFSFNKINFKLEKLLSKNNNEMSQLVYYNINGIINLKLGNYTLAGFNFLKAISIIKLKSPMQIIKRNHYYPQAAYNLSLSFFYLKQYNKCFNLLSYLLKTNGRLFNNNPYFYYRLSLSQLEMAIQTHQLSSNKSNNLYQYSKKCFLLNTYSSITLLGDILINLKKALHLFNRGHPIYFNCYFSLIFCMILNKAYTEAIYHLHIIIKALLSTDEQNKEIAQMYLMECYLNTGQITQAKRLSENILLSSSFTSSVYEYINGQIISNENFNLCYYLNMIRMNVLSNSRDEIEKHLIYILNSINFSISVSNTGGVNKCEHIPLFLIHVFVYYYLFINRKDLALSILKTRRIKHIFLPKGNE